LKMGQNSRRVGEESFDMDKNANRIASMLVEIAQSTS